MTSCWSRLIDRHPSQPASNLAHSPRAKMRLPVGNPRALTPVILLRMADNSPGTDRSAVPVCTVVAYRLIN